MENGVTDDHIIRVDLEDRLNKDLRNPDTMLHYIHDKIKDNGLYYIIIDEVQLMDEFVDVLNSFRHIANADTYVTGSNSHFLSSDIPTVFRGRGETIHVSPLSFAEFYSARSRDIYEAWREYYTYDGLPLILSFDTDQKINYLKNLFETVYLADIIERHNVQNENEMRELVLIMASSIGSPCNPIKLSNTFKSVKNVNISNKTIGKYLTYLSESFLLNKAIRYDIKGKNTSTHSFHPSKTYSSTVKDIFFIHQKYISQQPKIYSSFLKNIFFVFHTYINICTRSPRPFSVNIQMKARNSHPRATNQ